MLMVAGGSAWPPALSDSPANMKCVIVFFVIAVLLHL